MTNRAPILAELLRRASRAVGGEFVGFVSHEANRQQTAPVPFPGC